MTISRTIQSISQYKIHIYKKNNNIELQHYHVSCDLVLAFCANIALMKAINTFSN